MCVIPARSHWRDCVRANPGQGLGQGCAGFHKGTGDWGRGLPSQTQGLGKGHQWVLGWFWASLGDVDRIQCVLHRFGLLRLYF